MTTSFRCEAARALGVPESQVVSFGAELPGYGPVAVARAATWRELHRMRRRGTLYLQPRERRLGDGR